MLLGRVILGVALFTVVLGKKDGPPSNACETMTPNHGVVGQETESPYDVTLSKYTYSPGEKINVTLSGNPAFKGFLIQPRPSGGSYLTYGSFNTPAGTKNPCSTQGTDQSTALSHNSPDLKTSVVMEWTAPSEDKGEISFYYTVVQTGSIFWVKKNTEVLTFQAQGTGPTQPPGQEDSINRDPECENTLGCYPNTCDTDCQYLVTWKNMADDVEFTVKQKAPISPYYMAIGFSKDLNMGDDSVVDCVVNADGTNVSVASSYNEFKNELKYNLMLSDETYGVSLVSGSYSNSVLSCTYRRKKSASLVTSTGSAGGQGQGQGQANTVAGSDGTFFDLAQSYYLMIAVGRVDGDGLKREHSVAPHKSANQIDFTKITERTGPTLPPTTGQLKKDEACGDSRGCFSQCDGSDCDFVLTWKDVGDSCEITLSCKRNGNGYCAIGMSKDMKMGDDSVIACVSSNGNVEPYMAYNPGKFNDALDNPLFGVSATSGSHEDGIISCAFTRKKTAADAGSTGRKKRAVTADASTFFDMNKNYFLLFATGPYGGGIGKHDQRPIVSTKEADFQSTEDIGGSAVKNTLIKVHGILMVAAWAFCACIGIFMASFYKDVWPEGMECCGQKRWFVVHRGLMVMTFLATATAFVIIFVHVEGWVEITGTTFEKSHPIIGCVVMGLTVINPIMAFFRPHPGTPNRPIFRAAHTLVGVAAVVMGVVNIFSGTRLSAADVPDYVQYILYAFCGWVVLMDICLVIYDCTKNSNSGSRKEAYEMQAKGSSTISGKGVDRPKIVALLLHVPVVLGLVVAVCIIIAIAKK